MFGEFWVLTARVPEVVECADDARLKVDELPHILRRDGQAVEVGRPLGRPVAVREIGGDVLAPEILMHVKHDVIAKRFIPVDAFCDGIEVVVIDDTLLGLDSSPGDEKANEIRAHIRMLVTAVLWARAANRKHPHPSRGRAFGRGLWVTIVAVVLGNVVRSVGQSFVLRSDLPTFGGQLLTNVVVSALTGLVLGLIVGLIAMLFAPRRPSSVDSPDSRD